MQNASNRNKGKKRQPEQSQTVIIPKISPEMLEKARREAMNLPQEKTPEPPAETTGEGTPHRGETASLPKTAPAKKRERAPRNPSDPPRSQKEAQAQLWRQIHDNHLWLNNPVMMRGLGLAPLVVAAINGKNALMLCVAAILLLTTTRVLAVALCHITGNRFRPVIYCYSAALLYIPTYILLYSFFGTDLTILGIYLPILIVEPVIIKRMESDTLETIGEAFRRGINNTFGLCIPVLLVGCLRELLATGTVFGNQVFQVSLLPLASQPAGGFILVGIIAAVWTAVANAYVHYKQQEVKRRYAADHRR